MSPLRNPFRRSFVDFMEGLRYYAYNPQGSVGAGLFNNGNTCYLNSVLQCLIHTPPLMEGLRASNHFQSCPAFCNPDDFCALCALKKQAWFSFVMSGFVIMPTEFCDYLKHISSSFQYGQQEDAHEFLNALLDCLHRNCVAGVPRKHPHINDEDSIIKQVFGGRLRSQVVCCKCGHISTQFENLLDLSLDIDKASSIIEALESFTAPERIEDRYTCEGCQSKVSVTKQLSVEEAPQVLVLHLKRFKCDGNSTEKIVKIIDYPRALDLTPYTSSKDDEEKRIYELYAIILHCGELAIKGHYVAIVRSSNDEWNVMDDQQVSNISPCTGFTRDVYLLFYIKKGSSSSFTSLMEQEVMPTCHGTAIPMYNKCYNYTISRYLHASNIVLQDIKCGERIGSEEENGGLDQEFSKSLNEESNPESPSDSSTNNADMSKDTTVLALPQSTGGTNANSNDPCVSSIEESPVNCPKDGNKRTNNDTGCDRNVANRTDEKLSPSSSHLGSSEDITQLDHEHLQKSEDDVQEKGLNLNI